jgi:hypothetical protein
MEIHYQKRRELVAAYIADSPTVAVINTTIGGWAPQTREDRTGPSPIGVSLWRSPREPPYSTKSSAPDRPTQVDVLPLVSAPPTAPAAPPIAAPTSGLPPAVRRAVHHCAPLQIGSLRRTIAAFGPSRSSQCLREPADSMHAPPPQAPLQPTMSYAVFRRRATAMPAKPIPSKAKEAGSGTVASTTMLS